MSTLVTTHEGLDRIVRGGRTVAEVFGGRAPRVVSRDLDPASMFLGVSKLVARFVEGARQRRQERLFEQLMNSDPRVYAEVQAAAARREWC